MTLDRALQSVKGLVHLLLDRLLIGFAIPLVVLVLKTAGQVLAPRVALPQRGGATNENGREDPSQRR